MHVTQKSIIVTGAGSGIGEGTARHLASKGARVIVNDIDAAAGERVVTAIRAAAGVAHFVRADVTCNQDVQALVAAAVQQHDGLRRRVARLVVMQPHGQFPGLHIGVPGSGLESDLGNRSHQTIVSAGGRPNSLLPKIR